MSDTFFSKMFLLGSLWNIGIGLAGLFFYDMTIALFFGPGAVAHNLVSGLFYRLFLMAVIAFGVGYFIVSRDLSRNRALVWLGLACKLILFGLFAVLFFDGAATLPAFLALCGDLAWSALFFLFLWQTRHRVKNIFIG